MIINFFTPNLLKFFVLYTVSLSLLSNLNADGNMISHKLTNLSSSRRACLHRRGKLVRKAAKSYVVRVAHVLTYVSILALHS